MPPVPPPPNAPVRDAELLRRFVAGGDETAFELLVWRHSRLVFEVCRRVLRNRHDAEDAAQATFLVLARKADTVRGVPAGWLARVAYRCALRMVNRSVNPDRKVGGCVPATPAPTDLAVGVHQELSAALDAELNRLPDRYRLPVVLCCLHGLSYVEAAAQLNWKPGTLSGRLSRAKALLRERLTARGITPTAAGFVAFLAVLSDSSACSPDLVRSITATAFGASAPARVAAAASGVCRMMTLKSFAAKSLFGLAAAVLLLGGLAASGAFASDPIKPVNAEREREGGKKETDLDRMRDDWVFESAEAIGGSNGIHQGWKSVVTFAGEYVTVSKYLGLDYSTRYTIDESKSPKQFDMTVPELAKKVLNFKDGSIKGIYKIDGDTLEMCLAGSPDAPRPTEFATGPGLNQFRFTLKRRKKGFHPDEETDLTIRVVDADGKPVDGAVVCHTMMYGQTNQDGERLGWTYYPGYPKALRTDKTGTLNLGVNDRRGLLGGLLYSRHEGRKLVALEPLSPARIMNGVTLTLRPEAKLSGKVVLPGGGGPGPTSVYLCTPTTLYAAGYSSPKGEFEFVVPPGEYRLLARGDYLSEEFAPGANSFPSLGNTVEVSVGKDGKEMKLEVKPSKLGALRGQPAPDLGEIAAWKNEAVKLADLKGKVVLIKFFGTQRLSGIEYEMPALIDLHRNHAAQGLVVVGVHVSGAYDEQVVTVKRLDEKLNELGGHKWSAKEVKFPIGLLAKKDGPVTTAYGSVPEPILIDRKGNVVGLFRPYLGEDQARLSKLLQEK